MEEAKYSVEDIRKQDFSEEIPEAVLELFQGANNWWAYRNYEKREVMFEVGLKLGRQSPAPAEEAGEKEYIEACHEMMRICAQSDIPPKLYDMLREPFRRLALKCPADLNKQLEQLAEELEQGIELRSEYYEISGRAFWVARTLKNLKLIKATGSTPAQALAELQKKLEGGSK